MSKEKEFPIGSYTYDSESETWEVRLDKESWFSCNTQIEAEILSRLVKIEFWLDKYMVCAEGG